MAIHCIMSLYMINILQVFFCICSTLISTIPKQEGAGNEDCHKLGKLPGVGAELGLERWGVWCLWRGGHPVLSWVREAVFKSIHLSSYAVGSSVCPVLGRRSYRGGWAGVQGRTAAPASLQLPE